MDVKLEKMENSRVKLTIEVGADKLEEGLAHAYRKVVKEVTIPGFRKGKAPRPILERQYGQGVLFEDAIDYLLPKLYDAAVEENEIRPVSQPDISLNDINVETGFSFDAEVDVFPEIELGEYKGLAVEKRIVEITDEQIEQELINLQNQHSELIVVDSRDDVQEGDFAIIDFKGFLDGVPFSGGAAEDHNLEIGSGQFIPGFEEQLIGMKVGEEKDIDVTFPENYGSPDLAGKAVVFNVKIKSLKERMLPELDDEFAKDVSEFGTLAELKADIREKLEKSATDGTKREVENKLIEQIIANSTINLPESMIEQQVDFGLNNLSTNLMYSGMTLEMYLEYMQRTEEDLREEIRPDAINQIKSDLLLDEIATKEGFSVSEEEVNSKIDELVEESNNPEQTRTNWEMRKGSVENMIKTEKTWDFLLEHANITEITADQIDDSEEETEAEADIEA